MMQTEDLMAAACTKKLVVVHAMDGN